VQGSKANASKIKVEVESEYDPFFNLSYECDGHKYKFVKAEQGVHADFQ
jgi:hypothetical protein